MPLAAWVGEPEVHIGNVFVLDLLQQAFGVGHF
jgi:hypothetical protein